MKPGSYPLNSTRNKKRYEFISEGPKGQIPKAIIFDATAIEGVYELSFGDVIEEDRKIDVSSISDNGDLNKVIATVINSVYDFTESHPEAKIIFTCSSESRNRLYRIAINRNYEQLNQDFQIFGVEDNQLVPFEPSKNFVVFLIVRR